MWASPCSFMAYSQHGNWVQRRKKQKFPVLLKIKLRMGTKKFLSYALDPRSLRSVPDSRKQEEEKRPHLSTRGREKGYDKIFAAI